MMQQWLEKDFLGYLKEWEDSVKQREGFTDAEKTMMLLSQETLEGLHITGNSIAIQLVGYCITKSLLITVKSFVELTKYILSLPELKGKYLLSEHFCQDPLENYFGQLRAHGGWCQNPTAQACINSAQSIRVQGSLSMVPVRGNSRRKRRLERTEKIDDTPLHKRKIEI